MNWNKSKRRIKKTEFNETEKRYKYDIRLLNMLAASGLKATSIAHEMHNDRNSLDKNVEYIVKALKRYQLWDIVNDTIISTGGEIRNIEGVNGFKIEFVIGEKYE